jgi:tRNA G37 N-methylase Trm5
MFSRGNITEKIRFGKLVQEGEIVLDMYAGIGYYTLPALVHGGAGHVYACEWNQHATDALKYNLSQNRVEARATVLVGDCRQLAREHCLVNMFDRVCLGLLPSSEGGWRTAIRSLRETVGGWLHVHGNVPDRELYVWKHWMCKTLLGHVDEDGKPRDWVVLCVGVEQVKSYAPRIHHYVADVFVGPLSSFTISVELEGHRAGILQNNNEFDACLEGIIVPPSCALSPDGVLHQGWMTDSAQEN